MQCVCDDKHFLLLPWGREIGVPDISPESILKGFERIIHKILYNTVIQLSICLGKRLVDLPMHPRGRRKLSLEEERIQEAV